MKLLRHQVDFEQLVGVATEACRLVLADELQELANRFGYAVALGREPSDAIQEDLVASLVSSGGGKISLSASPSVEIKYFKPNQDFYAVAECTLATSGGGVVLAELVICISGGDFHAALEQISGAA